MAISSLLIQPCERRSSEVHQRFLGCSSDVHQRFHTSLNLQCGVGARGDVAIDHGVDLVMKTSLSLAASAWGEGDSSVEYL